MPLSNVWVPRRDGRGLFVPKRPHVALPGGDISTVRQWANWIYPVPTRGVYWSGVDKIGVNGLYGGTADRTPTPYGLGINSANQWEWGDSVVNTPGGFSLSRQVMFSVFYLYDATKLLASGKYPSLGVERSINFDPIGPSSSEFGLHWSNQSGEQRVSASAGTDFGGTGATVTGVGNGLHVVVASMLVNGNIDLYLDGILVSTTSLGSYNRSSTIKPNFYWAGLGPGDQNVGVILFAGTIYDKLFTAAEAQAFTADPFGYFFVDPPRRRPAFSVAIQSGNYPASDITTTGWSAVPPGSLFSAVDEGTASDTDYIISPNLAASPGPAVMGLNQSIPAGTYTVSVRARYSLTAGQLRVSLLDSGGTSVGTSSWITVTGSFATYPVSITTTGTAARVKIEVQ